LNPWVKFLGALLAALALGALAGALASALLPCDWFGSNFEGACSYGVLWASLGIAAVVGVVAFAALLFVAFSRTVPCEERSKSARSLAILWFATVIASLAAGPLLPAARLDLMVVGMVHAVCTVALIVFSALVARAAGRSAALGLLALIPFAGQFVIAALLFRDARRFYGQS
jgi:hypothetical protein